MGVTTQYYNIPTSCAIWPTMHSYMYYKICCMYISLFNNYHTQLSHNSTHKIDVHYRLSTTHSIYKTICICHAQHYTKLPLFIRSITMHQHAEHIPSTACSTLPPHPQTFSHTRQSIFVILSSNKIAAVYNITHSPCTSTCTTHQALLFKSRLPTIPRSG